VPNALAGAGAAVIVPIAIILVVGLALFLPISPFLYGSFSITTVSGSVEINFITSSYSKVPLVKSYAVFNTPGNLSLPVQPIGQPKYTLTIEIRYGSVEQFQSGKLQPILTKTLSNAADGTYGFEALIFYMQETPSVPYIITVHISGFGIPDTVKSTLITP
jgi:hypothetical protein